MSWLDKIADRLDLPAREKDHVLDELADHFEQQKKRLLADGMSAEEAEAETARILGDPREVAATLQSVHSRSSWRSALLCAAPFLLLVLFWLIHPPWANRMAPSWGVHLEKIGGYTAWAYGKAAVSVVVAAAALSVIAGIGMYCIALREIRRGRRSPWIATWMAVGISLPMWAIVSGLDDLRVFGGLHTNYDAWYPWMAILAVSCAFLALVVSVVSVAGIRSRAALTSIVVALIAVAVWTVLKVYGCSLDLYPVSREYHLNIVLISVLALCGVVLISLNGQRVFAYPIYGNTGYWSLFSFSFLMLVVYAGLLRTDMASWTVVAVGILGTCASCIVFARCSDWRLKKLGLVPGILAGSFLFASIGEPHMDLWRCINIAEQIAIVALAIVFGIPAAYGLVASRRRSRIASRPLYGE